MGSAPGQVGDDRITDDADQRAAQHQRPKQEWQVVPQLAEISEMHDNVLNGFLDVRPERSACDTSNTFSSALPIHRRRFDMAPDQ